MLAYKWSEKSVNDLWRNVFFNRLLGVIPRNLFMVIGLRDLTSEERRSVANLRAGNVDVFHWAVSKVAFVLHTVLVVISIRRPDVPFIWPGSLIEHPLR